MAKMVCYSYLGHIDNYVNMCKQLFSCDIIINIFFVSFSPFYNRLEEKRKEMNDKRKDNDTHYQSYRMHQAGRQTKFY